MAPLATVTPRLSLAERARRGIKTAGLRLLRASGLPGVADLDQGCKSADFERILKDLRGSGRDIVTMDEALKRLDDPQTRPFAVLTFDDGYRSNIDIALPMLERHHAPATIFVPTEMVTRTINAWWLGLKHLFLDNDRVEIEPMGVRFSCPDRATKTAALRRATAWVWEDFHRADVLAPTFAKHGVSLPDIVEARAFDEAEMVEIDRHPLIEIGAHTTTHRALALLDGESVRRDILDNKTYLEDRLGRDVGYFAYPYGAPSISGRREAEIRGLYRLRRERAFPRHRDAGRRPGRGRPRSLPLRGDGSTRMKPADIAPPAPADADPDASPFRDAVLVHVVRQYKPSVGGLEDFVASLVARQRGRFRRIRIITCDRLFRGDGSKLAKREIIDGAEVVRLPYIGSTRYPICTGVLSELADADLVHVHAIDFFFDALAFTRRLHRKPLVATTHGGFFHSPDYRLLKRICESDYARFARIAPDKVRLIENGVDIEKFAGAGSPAPAKSLITIGRLAHNKRVDLLLDTMARLVASDPDWRLSIVGTPFDWSRDDIAAMIADRGLTGNVDLHVGPSDAEMRDLLGKASLFVSASRHEGFGIALIEAMSAGLSSVVEGNDAFAAFAQKHSGITLCDYGDPDSTAEAIRAAFAVIETDPQAARDTAIAQAQAYSWDATALRYEALYREVLGR
eukprot:jgi/Tetstr1/446421/TSEL_033963.t1